MCNTVKVARNSQNSRWPSTKDIMPQSPLRHLSAFGVLGHGQNLWLFDHRRHNPEVGEIFVSSGWRICRVATAALCNAHDDSEYHDRLAAAAEFRQRATFAAAFLDCATTLAPEIFTVLIAAREAKMVQLLSLILELRDAPSVILDPELDAQFEFFDWAIFSSLARQIFVDHPELQPQLTALHADIVVARRMIEDPLHTVHRVLADAKSRTRCHAQGCPQSLASTGTEFKRCSACRVVAYCGKACQTRAWKTGPHAHKHICAQIKALIAKGGGLDDRDVFVKSCREARVSADEALEVAKWDFNPGMTASKLEGRPAANIDSDGAAEFDEMFWKLNPSKHPRYPERLERMRSYWARDTV